MTITYLQSQKTLQFVEIFVYSCVSVSLPKERVLKGNFNILINGSLFIEMLIDIINMHNNENYSKFLNISVVLFMMP